MSEPAWTWSPPVRPPRRRAVVAVVDPMLAETLAQTLVYLDWEPVEAGPAEAAIVDAEHLSAAVGSGRVALIAFGAEAVPAGWFALRAPVDPVALLDWLEAEEA